MLIEKQNNIRFITHKEIMQFWNISQKSAQKRLWLIRSSLGKKGILKLSVDQFCKAEDITPEEFFNKMK